MRLPALRLLFSSLAVLAATTSAAAQPPVASFDELSRRLQPGDTVWITDSSGKEVKARLLDISPARLALMRGELPLEMRAADVVRIRKKQADPLWSGAAIGAAVALTPAILFCRSGTETGESCGENVGDLLLVGVTGAVIGALIDAAVKGRKVVYQRPGPRSSIGFAVSASRRSAHLTVSIPLR